MRYVNRSSVQVPKSLFGKKAEAARAEIAQYLDIPSERRAQIRPSFNSSIWKEADVRKWLAELFRNRCAYCESDISDGLLWEVEQFRPKVNAGNDFKSAQVEHYAWLAYDWENLISCCIRCNEAKKNLFPVVGPRGKINTTCLDLRESENTLLIDPCWDHPYEHLAFQATGHAVALTEKGQKTIDVLDLNREHLVESRQQSFTVLVQLLLHNTDINLIATGASNSEESYIFDNQPYPGACSNLVMRFMAEKGHKNLAGVAVYLSDMSINDRESELAAMIAFSSEDGNLDAYDKPNSPWAFFQTAIRNFVPGKREGEIFRSKDMDRMDTALDNIESVKIKNFKALESIEFELPRSIKIQSLSPSVHDINLAPCMIILGENATGKSTVLEAITLALLGTDQTNRLNKRVDSDDISPRALVHRKTLYGDNSGSADSLVVSLSFFETSQNIELGGSSKSPKFSGTKQPSKKVLAYGPRRYFSKDSRYQEAPFDRVVSLFDPMATIAEPVAWLANSSDEDFQAAVRALRKILALNNESIVTRKGGDILIDLDGQITPFKYMSVGYQSVISMAVDIMRELLRHFSNLETASAVVLIDEIETHLHPRWKILIMQKLREAMPKVQFIVTTHDPLCLRGMHNGEIFVLRREFDEEKDTYSGPPKIHPLTVMPGMDSDDILTSAGFGLTTTFLDETIEDNISEYSQLLLLQNRRALDGESLDNEDAIRLAEIRSKLGNTVTGFGGSPIEEAAIQERFDSPDMASSIDMPSNLESIIARAYKASKANND